MRPPWFWPYHCFSFKLLCDLVVMIWTNRHPLCSMQSFILITSPVLMKKIFLLKQSYLLLMPSCCPDWDHLKKNSFHRTVESSGEIAHYSQRKDSWKVLTEGHPELHANFSHRGARHVSKSSMNCSSKTYQFPEFRLCLFWQQYQPFWELHCMHELYLLFLKKQYHISESFIVCMTCAIYSWKTLYFRSRYYWNQALVFLGREFEI